MIRFVNFNDAPELLEIYAPSITETAASFEETLPSVNDMRSRIEVVSAKYPWFVFEKDSRVVGYAYAFTHRDRASYRWSVDVTVYVRNGFHGQGIGRALYTRLFESLHKQKFHRAYAGITLPNAGSVALHESMGFKKIAHYSEVGFKFGRWHDTGWWELALTQDQNWPTEPLSITDLT